MRRDDRSKPTPAIASVRRGAQTSSSTPLLTSRALPDANPPRIGSNAEPANTVRASASRLESGESTTHHLEGERNEEDAEGAPEPAGTNAVAYERRTQ